MSSRTVFHAQYLDKNTGELIEHRKNWISKNKERFIMVRITDGLQWTEMFSGNEIKTLLFLSSHIDRETHYIHVTEFRKHELSLLLGYTTIRSVNNTFNSIMKKGGMKKILPFNDTFMINPKFCYAGSSMNYDLIEKKYIELKV